MKEDLLEQIRLLRQYNYKKMRDIENTLNTLIGFARDDLKRIDRLEENIHKQFAKQKDSEAIK